MKLIIDISKETYEALVINQYCGSKSNLENIIVNSTPLPRIMTNNSCLDFDFDKVKEILKKDNLDNLIVDHTCEKGETDEK